MALNVDSLLMLNHNKRTRCRFSINAEDVVRKFETGTSSLHQRINALKKLGDQGYPIGLVIAPIIPIPDWQTHYEKLFHTVSSVLGKSFNLTIEFITHRFTQGSKDILLNWYPNTQLSFDESERKQKFNKFGGIKFVYKIDIMKSLKEYLYNLKEIYLPYSNVLYWT